MMALEDQVINPPARELLGCLEDALALFHTTPPKHYQLRTGAEVVAEISTQVDECCEGLAWVRVVTWYPTVQFPEQQTVYNRCAVMLWAVVLELGVLRCAPTPPPEQITSAAEHEALTVAVNLDSAAMQRAVCCFRDLNVDRMWVATPWAPLATEGGCAGGTMQLTVAMPPCNC